MRLFSDLKRVLPLLISGAIGALILASEIQPALFQEIRDNLLRVAQITTAIGLLLGLLHLLTVHLGTIRRRRPGWAQSIVLVVVAGSVFGLELFAGSAAGLSATQVTGVASDIFQYVYQPLATSVLALLTFFALRASWRALQTRPTEALLILLVAVIFLVASGPWAALLPGVRETLDWIQAYPALGVARGLLLGVALGALVATVRVLLGFDQPYLDR